MEVQHTRSSDTGLDCVVYSYLLKRGCSEERHYGMESVKITNVPTGHKSDYDSIVCAPPGLRAAEMTALPPTIIQEAKAIASRVSQQLLVWLI